MQREEWLDLEVGARVRHREIEYRVSKVVCGIEDQRSMVVFRGSDGRDVVTVRKPYTEHVTPTQFVDEAHVVPPRNTTT